MRNIAVLVLFWSILGAAYTASAAPINTRDKLSCLHDAIRYCSYLKRSDKNIHLLISCLQQNRQRLHDSCKKTLEKHGV